MKSIAFAEIYCDKSEIYCACCVCKVIISLCVKKDAVCEDDAVKDDECEREKRYENKELRRRARRAEELVKIFDCNMASIWPHVVNKAFTSGASITQANMLYAVQSKTIEKKEKEKKRNPKRKKLREKERVA